MIDVRTIIFLTPEHRELLGALQVATGAAVAAGEVAIALQMTVTAGALAARLLEDLADG